MKLEVNLSKKYFFILLGAILILAGAIYGFAYGGSNPAVMGHSFEEIDFPTGTIMTFNLGSCPNGWTKYTSANGRTIIGTSGSYGLGSTGGATTHTLTDAQMPSHTHGIPLGQGGGWNYPGGTIAQRSYYNGAEYTDVSGSAGSGQPHNNMQPYIALLYCQKN